MAAINQHVVCAMQTNINKLRDRMLCLHQFTATHDECLELVAPPEHFSILREASKYADAISSESWLHFVVPATLDGVTGPEIALMMRTHGDKTPPLKPRAPNFNIEAPAAKRVLDWATFRLEQGRMAGMCHYALQELNKTCSTGAQIRFLWPNVLQLCAKLTVHDNYENYNDRMAAWADRNAPFKAQSSVPALSADFRNVLRETSAWITKASLLSHDIAMDPPGEVMITPWGMEPFKVDGSFVARV